MKKLSKEAEEVVVRTRRRVEGVECDICKRLIIPTGYGFKENCSRYFEVMTGHHDWGNDSCDSIKHLDIYPSCIGDFVTKYAQECTGTKYLEMETNYISENKYDYD